MTMPIPQAFTFVTLGNDEGTNVRDSGFLFGPIISTSSTKPKQPDFTAYNRDLTTYPPELVYRLINPPTRQAISIQFYGDSEVTFTYPGNVVVEYEPGLDPVPNPNGTTVDDSHDVTDYGRGLFGLGGDVFMFYQFPRFHTDDPYNFQSSIPDFTPQTDDAFGGNDASNVWAGLPTMAWSINCTVQNGDSRVLNIDTQQYEYYPFSQTTSVLNYTAKFRIDYNSAAPQGNLCCPIRNAVVSGKASVWSVSFTAEALTENGGYDGIEITIGSDFTEEQEIDWSFTFDPDNPTPTTYEVPKLTDKITFINDWWIESITPPAP